MTIFGSVNMKSKFCLLLTLACFLAFTAIDGAAAGTGKILSWCSYLDKRGKYINRMRCIQTLGLSNTYCFNHIHWRNGIKAELNCETWLWNDLSGNDKARLDRFLGRWHGDSTDTPSTYKNKITGEIVIVHVNETSQELQRCEALGSGSAGTVQPGDICWLGNVAKK
jgi:hypothetical protein